jgi:hypothetical protein
MNEKFSYVTMLRMKLVPPAVENKQQQSSCCFCLGIFAHFSIMDYDINYFRNTLQGSTNYELR